jgi:putative flippase GtrA
VESQKGFMPPPTKWTLGFAGRKMRRSDFAKTGKFAALRRLILFNFAAVVGFILGTISFTTTISLYPNPTFAWLFGNVVGGLSHFGANWALQGQSKKEFGKCFVVFNATGVISFLLASVMFAVAEIFAMESTVSWLLGSVVGTLSHFVMNDKAININFKRGKFTRQSCDLQEK